MKRKEFLNLLDKDFSDKFSTEWDQVGVQIDGDELINGVLITLDITLDVILQAIQNNLNTIISHHPLFFGEISDLLKKDKLLKSKIDLIKKNKINIIIIHTNCDFNYNSISKKQAEILNLKNISHLKNNLGVFGQYKNKIELLEFVKILKEKFSYLVDVRTSIMPGENFKNFIIGSGASGDLIYDEENWDKVFLIGELKHHHWVFANENSIKLIEIGHFSEEVFKNIIYDFLVENNLENIKVLKSKEEYVFKTI